MRLELGDALAEKPAEVVRRHQNAGALMMAGMGYRLSSQADEAADHFRRSREEADALASPRWRRCGPGAAAPLGISQGKVGTG